MANGGSGSPLAIELSDINKSFGDVHANRNVSLTVVPGHIHGIIGENGAGKSTLVSILYGFYGADSGTIRINGETTTIRNSADAIGKGIGMVHQHFMLVPNFTVLENVMLGREGSLSVETGARKAREALTKLSQDFGLAVDPDMIVEDLPVGLQQRVEILKALFRGAEILILDEPTGVLTPQETEQLFDILRALRKQGVTILLITHKLKEIMAITDDVSVMRGGEMVAHLQTADTSPAELAELMVGRKVLLEVDHTPARPGAPVLDVQDLCLTDTAGIDQLKQISMTLREGEIVGIAGVSGNGQSELLDVLSGIMAPTGGHFTVGTNQITAERPSDPAELRDFGVAHVPEDRHKCGIVLPFSAAESMILGYSGGDEEDGGWWAQPVKAGRKLRRPDEGIRHSPAHPQIAERQFFRRQPAENCPGARDFDPAETASCRPADTRCGYRRDRVHPQTADRPSKRGLCDPARLGGARRDHEPVRPHPSDE